MRRPSRRGAPRVCLLSKKAQEEGRTILWVDESALYLLPAAVRTYAPRGQTPVLPVPLTRDHLSVISGITATGQLISQWQDHAYHSTEIVGFLEQVLAALPGPVLVLWDGAPIHRGQPIKDFLASEAAARLQLERLPAYAPDLNPDEGVWHHLKDVELANVCCRHLPHLSEELAQALTRLAAKPHVIQGCITECGYAL